MPDGDELIQKRLNGEPLVRTCATKGPPPGCPQCGGEVMPYEPTGLCPECACKVMGHLWNGRGCCRCGAPQSLAAGFAPPAAQSLAAAQGTRALAE